MKLFLSVLILTFSLNSYAGCSIFSQEQREVLQKSYEYGAEYDMGWSLAAIAWKESSAGVNKVNWNDPSAGVYHNLIHSVAARHGVVGNQQAEMILFWKLYHDINFAASEAIKELQYWYDRRSGNWRDIWASYNAGRNYKYRQGQTYSADILGKIRYLQEQRCVQ